MENNTHQHQEVVRILRNWKGSDPGDTASPGAVAEEIDHLYAEYLASQPARTLAIRRRQEECERKAAREEAAQIYEVEMSDLSTQFAPRPDDASPLPLSPGAPMPAVTPVRGANVSGENPDEVPRLANVLVGLIVIVAVCAMALLAWRLHAL